MLSPEEEQLLEEKLIRYEDSTSNQISIVLINSLEGYDVADYAVNLALKWGIGSKNKNNGILLLAAIQDRKIRIEVGYGLEPVVTDALSKQIITEYIRPYFKEGNYYKGLDEGTSQLFRAAAGEFKGEYKYSKNLKKNGRSIGLGTLLVILIILFIILKSGGGKGKNRGRGGDFLTGFLLGQLLNGGHRSRGGWGNFSSGSGSFGGFGGGSFGGGGASGDW